MQTPFQPVPAWRQRQPRVTELNKPRSMVDPFELLRSIDRKLESIYVLANRRLSQKAITSSGATATAAAGDGYFLEWLDADPEMLWHCLSKMIPVPGRLWARRSQAQADQLSLS